MTITSIVRQRGDLFVIEADGEQAALLDLRTLEDADDLAVGFEVSEERMAQLQLESDCHRARSKALKLVSGREMCRVGLIRKLSDAGFSEEACASAAEEMEKLGFIRDERYAEMYAEELYRVKRYAAQRVVYELTQRGIARDLAQDIASRLAPDAKQTLRELINDRLAKDMESESGRRRCYNTLSRYGYTAGDIRSAMREFAADGQ